MLGNDAPVDYQLGGMDEEFSTVKARLTALVGMPIEDEEIARLLSDVSRDGGGVTIEVGGVRFKLLRRDGRFLLKKDDPRHLSTAPPPIRRR